MNPGSEDPGFFVLGEGRFPLWLPLWLCKNMKILEDLDLLVN